MKNIYTFFVKQHLLFDNNYTMLIKKIQIKVLIYMFC